MPEDSSFARLMAHLQAGDDEAAAHVFRRFARRLIALAQAHLSAALRQKEGPEDVVQSAFKSFFRRQADQPYEVDGWDALWSLLALLTVRKCQDRAEAFGAARRDIRREVPAPEMGDSSRCWEPLARDPTPEHAALLAEVVEQLHRQLGERDRRILTLRLQGEEIPAISTQVGCTERTVFRVLWRIRRHLQHLCEEDAGRR